VSLQLGEVLRRSAEYLAGRGSPTPRLDAELLLAHALGLSRIELYTHHDRPLTAAEMDACRELVRRRGEREPVAYVTGRRGFRRLDLAVDARVLVPRPETELVVDRCLELLAGRDAPSVLDVGTGSGAIALSVALEHPGARVTASDVSADALAVAASNAAAAGLDVELLQSDLFQALERRAFDLVVSNPPYVAASEMPGLEPEVARHEPRLATTPGDDGLAVYRRLLPDARDHLVPGGHLVVECGAGQAAWIRDEMERLAYGDLRIDRDLAGIERVVSGRWRS
jgi:release factor glutamine methyltransferase